MSLLSQKKDYTERNNDGNSAWHPQLHERSGVKSTFKPQKLCLNLVCGVFSFRFPHGYNKITLQLWGCTVFLKDDILSVSSF